MSSYDDEVKRYNAQSIYDRALTRCREVVYDYVDYKRYIAEKVKRLRQLEESLSNERALAHPRPDVIISLVEKLGNLRDESEEIIDKRTSAFYFTMLHALRVLVEENKAFDLQPRFP